MKGKILQNKITLAILIICIQSSLYAYAGSEKNYIFSTATTGGTYYPVGVAFATLTKVKLQPKKKISLTAISSAGSGENVKLLRKNKAQFAILQGLYGAWAWNGTGQVKHDGPQKHLRSVTMLWQNVEHFVIDSKYIETGTMRDLKHLTGQKFSIGKKNSGTEGSGRHILTGLGIDADLSFKLIHMSYSASADAIQKGDIVGMNIPAGPPINAIKRVFSALGNDVTILNFTDEEMQKANNGLNLWTRYVIPAYTYPSQHKAINTIAQPNFMVVRADVDPEAVYNIVKSIYDNLPFLHHIHQATKAMSLDKAIVGLPIPLHPGALRYYQEQGLDIPKSLIAK